MTGRIGEKLILGIAELCEEDSYILRGVLGDSNAFFIGSKAGLEIPMVMLSPVLLNDSGNVVRGEGHMMFKEKVDYIILNE